MRLTALAVGAAVAGAAFVAPAHAVLICVSPNDQVQVCDGANYEPQCVYGHVRGRTFETPTC